MNRTLMLFLVFRYKMSEEMLGMKPPTNQSSHSWTESIKVTDRMCQSCLDTINFLTGQNQFSNWTESAAKECCWLNRIRQSSSMDSWIKEPAKLAG